MKRAAKHPEQMSTAELAQATAEFDRPFVYERARPMTASERAQERKLRRPRARSNDGTDVRRISISLEGELLKRAAALAKKRGIKRSELIAGFIEAGLGRKVI